MIRIAKSSHGIQRHTGELITHGTRVLQCQNENLIADGIANGSDALIASVPDYIANAAEIAGVSIQNLVSQLGNTVNPAEASVSIYEAIENPLVLPVVRIISFFILYSAMNVIVSIAILLVCKVFKLPVLKSFNKLLGAIVGGLRGVIIVAVVSIVLGLIAMVVPGTEFTQALDGSFIYGIFSGITHTIFGS